MFIHPRLSFSSSVSQDSYPSSNSHISSFQTTHSSSPSTLQRTSVSYLTPISPSINTYLASQGPATTTFANLRRIRRTLDFDTAHTIATSLVHSKLDYCN